MSEAIPIEAADQLERYAELLRTRAVPAGLISKGDVDRVQTRHIADSLRATALVAEAEEAVDLGSGAGLPGLPLAIATPSLTVALAESRRSRIAFLELVLDELRLPNVRLFAGRVEDLPQRVDLALARGFASPARTWVAAERLLRPAGRLLYWAGSGFRPEQAPHGVSLTVVRDADLESAGPIVIMARQ
jgi:16S rRNA (guanine527-N7)-methyltransferase